MTTGSSDTRPFGKWFQIRWAEKLGDQKDPYLIRWTLIIFGYSIRVHHWLKSDDRRYFHDHSADLLSVVLKGWYFNVVPIDETKPPSYKISNEKRWIGFKPICGKYGAVVFYSGTNTKYNFVEGMFNSWENFKHCWSRSIWFSKAKAKHYLSIPKSGAWTLLFEGRKYHKWGFYVPRMNKRHELVSQDVVKMRPYRYFEKFGIIQTKSYQ